MDVQGWYLKYHWAVNLVLLAVLALLCARTANSYLEKQLVSALPESAPKKAAARLQKAPFRAPVSSILARDLFKAAERSQVEAEVSDGGTSGEIQETTLRLKLLATVIFGQVGNPNNIATIKVLKEQKTGIYVKGSKVVEDATVEEVQVDKVILVRADGSREELKIKEEAGLAGGGGRKPQTAAAEGIRPPRPELPDIGDQIKQVSDNEFVIQREAIEQTLSNLNSIVTQARVIPNFSTGEGGEKVVDGFRIYRIQPRSIFQFLGLRNGDVIKSINGEKMDSVEKGIKLLQDLRNETRFSLNIERQRSPLEISYEVE